MATRRAEADLEAETRFPEVSLDVLIPHPRNPRKGNIEAIARSIQRHGFHGALIVQRSTNRILIGEHRWRAAALAGLEAVPVEYVDDNDDEALARLLDDNRASDLAEYDMAIMADIFTVEPPPTELYGEADIAALLAFGAPATEETATGTSSTLDDQSNLYGAVSVRQLVLGYARNDYQWVVARLGELRERWNMDTNSAVLVKLIADVVGQQPPR